MKKAEKELLLRKAIVEKYLIKPGTEVDIVLNNTARRITINWVNQNSFNFGSDETVIHPKDIVSIAGTDVRLQIADLKKEIFSKKPAINKKTELVHFRASTKIFREIIKLLSPLVTECKMSFDKTGLNIRTVDPAHVAMIVMQIKKTEFKGYRCKKEQEFGIDLTELDCVIHECEKEAAFDFCDYGGTTILFISYCNEFGAYTRKMKTIEVAGMPDPKMPNLNNPKNHQLPAQFEIEPNGILKFLRQAEFVSDQLVITANKKGIRFYAYGDEDDVEFVPAKPAKYSVSSKNKSLFALYYFSNAITSMKHYKTISMMMSTDNPIQISGAGEINIVYLLAPRIETE